MSLGHGLTDPNNLLQPTISAHDKPTFSSVGKESQTREGQAMSPATSNSSQPVAISDAVTMSSITPSRVIEQTNSRIETENDIGITQNVHPPCRAPTLCKLLRTHPEVPGYNVIFVANVQQEVRNIFGEEAGSVGALIDVIRMSQVCNYIRVLGIDSFWRFRGLGCFVYAAWSLVVSFAFNSLQLVLGILNNAFPCVYLPTVAFPWHERGAGCGQSDHDI